MKCVLSPTVSYAANAADNKPSTVELKPIQPHKIEQDSVLKREGVCGVVYVHVWMYVRMNHINCSCC